jgi:hypothetical protein
MARGNFQGILSLPGQFRDCGANIYEVQGTAEDVKSMTREAKAKMATDAWYEGQRLYDYTTASPTSLTDMDRTK